MQTQTCSWDLFFNIFSWHSSSGITRIVFSKQGSLAFYSARLQFVKDVVCRLTFMQLRACLCKQTNQSWMTSYLIYKYQIINQHNGRQFKQQERNITMLTKFFTMLHDASWHSVEPYWLWSIRDAMPQRNAEFRIRVICGISDAVVSVKYTW